MDKEYGGRQSIPIGRRHAFYICGVIYGRGGNMNEYLAYPVTCSRHPVDNLVVSPSQTSLAPTHLCQMDRKLRWSGGETRTKNLECSERLLRLRPDAAFIHISPFLHQKSHRKIRATIEIRFPEKEQCSGIPTNDEILDVLDGVDHIEPHFHRTSCMMMIDIW